MHGRIAASPAREGTSGQGDRPKVPSHPEQRWGQLLEASESAASLSGQSSPPVPPRWSPRGAPSRGVPSVSGVASLSGLTSLFGVGSVVESLDSDDSLDGLGES